MGSEVDGMLGSQMLDIDQYAVKQCCCKGFLGDFGEAKGQAKTPETALEREFQGFLSAAR